MGLEHLFSALRVTGFLSPAVPPYHRTNLTPNTKINIKEPIAPRSHLHARGAHAQTFTRRHLISRRPEQTQPVIQPIRLFHTDTHQRRARSFRKLRDDTHPQKGRSMPFPVRPIPSNRIRHIQHHVQSSRSKTTALIILLRIIRRSHPLHTVIRNQSILPLHAPSDGKLRCKPLPQRPVQSERHTLRNHLREVTPIRIHQAHVRPHLHEPVIPHPIRPHSRLFTFHFSFFTSIGGSQIYLGA